MDNKIEKIETNEAEILASNSPAPATKVKKRTALKVVTATFYSVITLLAFGLNMLLLYGSIKYVNTEALGWESLGRGISLVIIFFASIILGVATILFYLIPFTLSVVGLKSSLKMKNGYTKQDKAFFSVFLSLTVILGIVLAIISASIAVYTILNI